MNNRKYILGYELLNDELVFFKDTVKWGTTRIPGNAAKFNSPEEAIKYRDQDSELKALMGIKTRVQVYCIQPVMTWELVE